MMYKLQITQIFDTNPKDITLYLQNVDAAYAVMNALVRDTSVLDVTIYKDDQVIKKSKNEVNWLKYWGKK